MADAFTSETYNALCRDAEGYLARGLAEQARELLLKATSLIGTRPRARSLLADACMQLGLWSEAKSQLEALATLEVDNIYTHFRLGQVLEETGELELARDNFRVVLDMNPDHHGAKVSMARLEKGASEEEPDKPNPPREGQQIFADESTDSVFAEESSDGVDELLSTIGIGEKQDVPGVEDLLNSIGIREEKKEEEQKVDFGAIFGGGQTQSARSESPSNESPLASVFGTQSSGGTSMPESNADLNALFGGEDSDDAEKKAEETPEEEEGTVTDAAADLNSIFGGVKGDSGQEPLPAEPAEETSAEDSDTTDLNAIFGGTEKEESEEQKPDEQQVDLDSVFGKSPLDKTAHQQEEVEPEHYEQPVQVSMEVPVPSEQQQETYSEKPSVAEGDSTDLSAIFGTAPEEEKEEPVEEPEQEAPVEESSEKPEQETPVEESSGEPEQETPVEEYSGEPEQEDPSEEPAEGSEKLPEEEVPSEEPAKDSEEAPEREAALAPVEAAVSTGPKVSYEILPGDSSALCSLRIDSGSLRVISSFIAAMSGDVKLEGDLLSGSGMAWLGQGSLTPVIVDYADGMTVRIDRLAVRPEGVTSTSSGIDAAPSLRKLQGGEEGTLLMFITGRQKKITVVPGLRIKTGCILASEPGVSFSQEEDGFLTVSGSGRVIITG